MTALLALLLSAGAHAHAMLLRFDPTDGAQLRAAPAKIVVWFTKPLEPRFSRVEVTDGSGAAVASQPPQPLPSNASGLSAALPALAAGQYHVRWTVISIDSHRTNGTVGFTVLP
ncbi:MAG: copper resistance CopC family protein [Janthinobacterium lividum]